MNDPQVRLDVKDAKEADSGSGVGQLPSPPRAVVRKSRLLRAKEREFTSLADIQPVEAAAAPAPGVPSETKDEEPAIELAPVDRDEADSESTNVSQRSRLSRRGPTRSNSVSPAPGEPLLAKSDRRDRDREPDDDDAMIELPDSWMGDVQKRVKAKIDGYKARIVALRKSRDVLMEQNKALNDMLEEAGKEKELDDNNRYLKGVPIDGKDDGEEDLRAKDLRRRELLAGIEQFKDDDIAPSIEADKAERTCWQRFWIQTYALANSLMPFKARIRRLGDRFGPGIASFFKFYRWMVLNTIFFTVVWGLIFLRQTMLYYEDPDVSLLHFESVLPKFTYFSQFKAGGFVYTGAIIATTFYLCVVSIAKWISEDRFSASEKLLDEKQDRPMRYATLSFSFWDFAVDNAKDSEQQRWSVYSKFNGLLEEDSIAEKIKQRTQSQRVGLWACRILGMVINLIILGISMLTIVMVSLYQEDVAAFCKGTYFDGVASFVAPTSISVINALLPHVTIALTRQENWDHAATLVKHQMWRLFLARQCNLVIYLATFFSLAQRKSLFSFAQFRTTYDTSAFECGEDAAGNGIFILVLVEFVGNKLVLVLIYLGKSCALKCCPNMKSLRQTEYNPALSIVEVLYFQSLLWTAMPFYPFSCMLMTLLVWGNFTFDQFLLTDLRNKPSRSLNAKETGVFFVQFYVITLIMVLAEIYYFVTSPWPCLKDGTTTPQGAFTDIATYKPWDSVSAYLSTSSVSLLFSIITTPAVYVVILVFFLLRYNFVRNQLKATQLLVQRERDVHYNELQNLQHLVKKQARMLEAQRQAAGGI